MANVRLLGLILCGACAALGCGADISRTAPAPDCAAGANYDLTQVLIDAATITSTTTPGYGFGDGTPGSMLNGQPPGAGIPSGVVKTVPEPTLTCGQTRVVDVSSSGHNDYGSSVFFDLGGANGTGSEGIFFWARAPLVASNNSVILELSDHDTASGKGGCVDPPSGPIDASGMATTTVNTPGGTAANQLPLYEPAPGTCGNFFQTVFEFTSEWTLYILPYEQFGQLQQPNRIASGFNPSELDAFAIQIPKEANFEVWINRIGVYKSASASAGP